MKSTLDKGSLATELARLPHLDRKELADKWRTLYGTEPPHKIGSKFLIYAIAYQLQETAYGGLKPATHRYLTKVAAVASARQNISHPPTLIKAGTRLLREWHGVMHEVIILENGVECAGKRYRSLSEVARTITGTQWSGPLFFGIKKRSTV